MQSLSLQSQNAPLHFFPQSFVHVGLGGPLVNDTVGSFPLSRTELSGYGFGVNIRDPGGGVGRLPPLWETLPPGKGMITMSVLESDCRFVVGCELWPLVGLLVALSEIRRLAARKHGLYLTECFAWHPERRFVYYVDLG